MGLISLLVNRFKKFFFLITPGIPAIDINKHQNLRKMISERKPFLRNGIIKFLFYVKFLCTTLIFLPSYNVQDLFGEIKCSTMSWLHINNYRHYAEATKFDEIIYHMSRPGNPTRPTCGIVPY